MVSKIARATIKIIAVIGIAKTVLAILAEAAINSVVPIPVRETVNAVIPVITLTAIVLARGSLCRPHGLPCRYKRRQMWNEDFRNTSFAPPTKNFLTPPESAAVLPLPPKGKVHGRGARKGWNGGLR